MFETGLLLIKNVIAIASGILEGLGYSESTRCFLITESLHDIRALIVGLGGKKNTILSFAGVGDLTLTATSVKSRNYSFGVLLGKGDKKKISSHVRLFHIIFQLWKCIIAFQ